MRTFKNIYEVSPCNVSSNYAAQCNPMCLDRGSTVECLTRRTKFPSSIPGDQPRYILVMILLPRPSLPGAAVNIGTFGAFLTP